MLLSRIWLFVTPWTVAYQAPLSMGIFQARILEWVRGSSRPRDRTWVSCIVGGRFIIWAITGKIIALTMWTFVGKMMSLLFSMLSRLVIASLPRSKRLLISWLQSPSAVILEPKKIKPVTVSLFPHLFAMKWWDHVNTLYHCMIFKNLHIYFLIYFCTNVTKTVGKMWHLKIKSSLLLNREWI